VTSMNYEEQREFTRLSVELEITLYHEMWVHPIKVKSKDISLGGIFIYTSFTKDLPNSMLLSVTIPTVDERFVTFKGEVVHSVPKVGVGIRFLTKSNHLNSLIAKLRRSLPSE
jgi:c-di-GMP-binding flagellar brake protein YcgR